MYEDSSFIATIHTWSSRCGLGEFCSLPAGSGCPGAGCNLCWKTRENVYGLSRSSAMDGVAETLDANPTPGSSNKRESLRTNESNGKCQIWLGVRHAWWNPYRNVNVWVLKSNFNIMMPSHYFRFCILSYSFFKPIHYFLCSCLLLVYAWMTAHIRPCVQQKS